MFQRIHSVKELVGSLDAGPYSSCPGHSLLPLYRRAMEGNYCVLAAHRHTTEVTIFVSCQPGTFVWCAQHCGFEKPAKIYRNSPTVGEEGTCSIIQFWTCQILRSSLTSFSSTSPRFFCGLCFLPKLYETLP